MFEFLRAIYQYAAYDSLVGHNNMFYEYKRLEAMYPNRAGMSVPVKFSAAGFQWKEFRNGTKLGANITNEATPRWRKEMALVVCIPPSSPDYKVTADTL